MPIFGIRCPRKGDQMQIRRVIGKDGGNHIISDKLQYREKPGDTWQTVEVMSVWEANEADEAEIAEAAK